MDRYDRLGKYWNPIGQQVIKILIGQRKCWTNQSIFLVGAWQSLIIFGHNLVRSATSEWQSRFSWSTWYWSRWRHHFISNVFGSLFIWCAIFCVDFSTLIYTISSFRFWFRSILIFPSSIGSTIFTIFLWCFRRFNIRLTLADFT